jgi:tetratricopeptide (TPR) repeat protein
MLALFDEALARNPKNTTAYLWRTIVYLDLGYFDKAERDARQCLDLDPAYEICRSFLALATLFAGDTERALEIHETALRHGFNGNNFPFLFVFVATGEERTALAAMAANNAGRGINKATAFEYRALADPAFDYKAEKALIDQAYFRAGAAEPDWSPANPDFLFLYRQYDQLKTSDLSYWWFPYPLEFRNSPHRKRMMREMGIPEYWRKHGFPPQCRAKGADDFECD